MATSVNSNTWTFTDATNGTTLTTTAQQIQGSLGLSKTLVTHGSFGITAQTGTDVLIYCPSGQTIQLTGPVNLNTSVRYGGGISTAVNIYTADQTLGTEGYVVANKATAIAFALPSAASLVGRVYNIKSIGVGTLTINRAGADTIDGITSAVLTTNQAITLVATTSSTWNIF